ncbi:hypothetical protein DFJ58DRAFT_766862 [Suillus subalutaceus]|uniref:uncharacterized protein n=1 Tax=Suillus subalutaceus TaxID=48586 RepID=UPI001B862036|nr:uncharacterized protein DFJ58DRAFT_766862 [Suillus subalutaceus]KAG1869048.1 hypothetical protein DFJ58DRAFT_766862 [Suillus subalutaceus]
MCPATTLPRLHSAILVNMHTTTHWALTVLDISPMIDTHLVRNIHNSSSEVGEKVALSRCIEKHWRLVGWGSIQRGAVLELD